MVLIFQKVMRMLLICQIIYQLNSKINWQKMIKHKKDYKIKARDSDFKKALVSLGCETVGECKHKISKRKVTLLIIKNHEFFTDKTKSEMVNKYWVPLDADAPNETSDQIRNKMTPDQIKELDYGQGEIQRFEDFRFDDKDPDEDIAFEEIRKRRKS
jgi:hypothetical protein